MSSGLSLVNQQRNARAVLQGFGQCLLAAPVTGDNHWTNLIPYNGCVGQSPVETNHQLESRMRESRLSGSERGAILIRRVSENFVCGSQREIKDGSDEEEGARGEGTGRQEAGD